MYPVRPDGFDRTAAGSLWRHTLAQLSSIFGRLLYLTSLRGTADGRYRHQGLEARFGEEEAHQAMLGSHEESFASWLGRTIEQQKDDIDLYFSDSGIDRIPAIATWLRQPPDVTPLTIRESERQLFHADFEALLEVLRAEVNLPPAERED